MSLRDIGNDDSTFANLMLLLVCAARDACSRLVDHHSLRQGVPAVHGAVWGSAQTALIRL